MSVDFTGISQQALRNGGRGPWTRGAWVRGGIEGFDLDDGKWHFVVKTGFGDRLDGLYIDGRQMLPPMSLGARILWTTVVRPSRLLRRASWRIRDFVLYRVLRKSPVVLQGLLESDLPPGVTRGESFVTSQVLTDDQVRLLWAAKLLQGGDPA